jgi:hypothetical protein
VDGLNVLGQKRERLGKARSWVLDPRKPYTIPGWFLSNPGATSDGGREENTLKRFQFTDVAKSVAMRQNFGDSIGLITAAFYAERGRAVGVGEGPEEQRDLQVLDFHPGRLLAVVNIRYVDERDLQQLLDGQ